MNKQRLAILITAAVGALSTFMPWAKAPIVGSVPGTEIEDGLGWISFGLFGTFFLMKRQNKAILYSALWQVR